MSVREGLLGVSKEQVATVDENVHILDESPFLPSVPNIVADVFQILKEPRGTQKSMQPSFLMEFLTEELPNILHMFAAVTYSQEVKPGLRNTMRDLMQKDGLLVTLKAINFVEASTYSAVGGNTISSFSRSFTTYLGTYAQPFLKRRCLAQLQESDGKQSVHDTAIATCLNLYMAMFIFTFHPRMVKSRLGHKDPGPGWFFTEEWYNASGDGNPGQFYTMLSKPVPPGFDPRNPRETLESYANIDWGSTDELHLDPNWFSNYIGLPALAPWKLFSAFEQRGLTHKWEYIQLELTLVGSYRGMLSSLQSSLEVRIEAATLLQNKMISATSTLFLTMVSYIHRASTEDPDE